MPDRETTVTNPLTNPQAHRLLEPKLIAIFREGYSRKLFLRDLVAGVTVGIVALPLCCFPL